MEKRAAAAFWLLFVFLFVVICVLSFQSGSTTKALEKPFVETVTGTVDRQLSRETILTITFYIRQAGRNLFRSSLFRGGLSGSGGALLSFRRVNRPALGIGSCAVLFGISYFTEKMKIFIEGRHYAFAECLESFVFAALGWLCMALFFSLKSRKRSCYVSEEIKSAESDHHHH